MYEPGMWPTKMSRSRPSCYSEDLGDVVVTSATQPCEKYVLFISATSNNERIQCIDSISINAEILLLSLCKVS